jgi:hypothetical protein
MRLATAGSLAGVREKKLEERVYGIPFYKTYRKRK